LLFFVSKECTFYTNNTSNKLLEEHKDINNIIENLISIEKGIDLSININLINLLIIYLFEYNVKNHFNNNNNRNK
jgi:hypothetical protein